MNCLFSKRNAIRIRVWWKAIECYCTLEDCNVDTSEESGNNNTGSIRGVSEYFIVIREEHRATCSFKISSGLTSMSLIKYRILEYGYWKWGSQNFWDDMHIFKYCFQAISVLIIFKWALVVYLLPIFQSSNTTSAEDVSENEQCANILTEILRYGTVCYFIWHIIIRLLSIVSKNIAKYVVNPWFI